MENPPAGSTPPDGQDWSFVALIPDDGREPGAQVSDGDALATWGVVSALWHPALLARSGGLPQIEDVEFPEPPGPRQVRVVASGAADRLPSGYRTQAEDSGAILIEAEAGALTDRSALIAAIRERIGAGGSTGSVGSPEEEAVALDFLALGMARWWLRDLTIAMAHADCLDMESLSREVLAGAHAWHSGDSPAATNRLRAAFELLTQARERFYPVDAYLIDVCLIDPSTPAGALADALAARTPVTLLATARAIEALADRDPERLAALREAIGEGWADVVGGAYDEVAEPLLPLESILWQFRQGAQVYRQHLDERQVEAVARRRFGLYPQLPQVAKRFGLRFALHMAFDAGKFPVRPEAKRLWEAPDGTSLETLTRPPLAADRPREGLQFPWRLARTMKDDHVATLPMVHWPHDVAPWYRDLRRVASYSPVFARGVTLNDYFHLTDRPFESFRPELDDYTTPYLAQAVARREPDPISRGAEHARLRARFDALGTVRALATLLSAPRPAESAEAMTPAALEQAIETGAFGEARAALDVQEPLWAGAIARGVVGGTTDGRPGYLVVNPAGVPRRAAVLLPDASIDLRPEGPLRAAQFTEEGVWAVVELAAFGFAWVPRESGPEALYTPNSRLSVRDRTLRNESMEVEIDTATGGIRSLKGANEPTPRLGQQLVATGAGAAVTSRMHCETFEVDYGGPALVQAFSRGNVVETTGDRRLATFHQRYRLWSGRPVLEIDVTLSDLDPAWLDALASGDPWAHALACRWAWPDPTAMLRRTSLLGPELTEAERPETPDVFDISTRRERTALLFGGLAHHHRRGPRMLDTLLVAGREAGRTFRLGVALDLEYPFHAAVDFLAPAFVVPLETGLPAAGPSGWFFQIDHKAVAVTHVAHADPSGDGRGWGVVFHLLETAGRSARCRLRLYRDPVWARQVDFLDEPIVDLPIDGDSVLIDLTPHEMARIDVTLG